MLTWIQNTLIADKMEGSEANTHAWRRSEGRKTRAETKVGSLSGQERRTLVKTIHQFRRMGGGVRRGDWKEELVA